MSATTPVYSIAKTFTAAAACLSLDLSDAIGKHLPGLTARVASLTVRDLLSHRSGLNDYFGWSDYLSAVESRQTSWPAEAVVERATVGTPGEFRYSNIGYLLIKLALEQKHEDTLFAVLNRLVLTPLEVPAAPFDSLADWSSCTHPEISKELRAYDPGWVYPGTFIASVDDVARGIALLMSGTLGTQLAKDMQETLPVDAPGHPFSPAGYGLGVMTSGMPPTIVGHGGGGPGFSLFAAATTHGERWQGAVAAGEDETLDVIRFCVEALSVAST